jgi:hypothetical protein
MRQQPPSDMAMRQQPPSAELVRGAHEKSHYDKQQFFSIVRSVTNWTATPFEERHFQTLRSDKQAGHVCSIGDSINREIAGRLEVLFPGDVRFLNHEIGQLEVEHVIASCCSKGAATQCCRAEPDAGQAHPRNSSQRLRSQSHRERPCTSCSCGRCGSCAVLLVGGLSLHWLIRRVVFKNTRWIEQALGRIHVACDADFPR